MSWGGHATDLRAQEAAEALEGLSYGTDPGAYCRALYPHDDWRQALEMGRRQSGCGLVALAILRAIGAEGRCRWQGRDLDLLREPYAGQLGLAIALLERLALARGVLQVPGLGAPRPELSPGCVVLVGGDDGLPPERRVFGGLAHVLTVVALEGDVLVCIEGGQTDPVNQGRPTAIRRKRRELVHRAGFWWLRDAGGEGAGRRLRWWFDANAMQRAAR
jgi:hypothetical protein